MKIVNVISDTHGLLREEVMENLKDSDLILHIGDIGSEQILEKLRKLAPIIAVKGNIDEKIQHLKDIDKIIEFEIEEFNCLMVHNIRDIDIKSLEDIDIVFYGHSHMPYEKVKENILYLNPGSVGRRRFTLPISMLKLKFDKNKVALQWITL